MRTLFILLIIGLGTTSYGNDIGMSLNCRETGDQINAPWGSSYGIFFRSDYNDTGTITLLESAPVRGKELGIKTDIKQTWTVTSTGKLGAFFYVVASNPQSTIKIQANNVAPTPEGTSWVWTALKDQNQNEISRALNCQVTVTNPNLIPDLQETAPSEPVEIETK